MGSIIMKIYALDIKEQGFKPHKVLDWLGIEYHKFFNTNDIPNCPNDIIVASAKQFFEQEYWDSGAIQRTIDTLSPKFKKVILFNDDYTGDWPQKIDNVYLLGLEIRTNCDSESENYRKLFNEKYHFNYVTCRTELERVMIEYPKLVKSFEHKLRDKSYTNLNRFPKSHRVGLIIRLMENNLLDVGFNSLLTHKQGYKEFNTILHDNENQSIFLEENKESIEKLSDMLPLVLDLEQGEDGQPVGDDTITIPYPLFLNSYFSIVTESHFREVDKFIISEKISKALVGMHPFFLYAQPYSLKYLKDNGFQTFGDIIDESYDEETDDKKRFEMVTQEIIKFFKNNTLEDLHKLYYGKLYERLLHNYQRHTEFVEEELEIIVDIIEDKL
tara:strand:+ start:2386 stop:3540 length:1155 start_codon:yes stop_codon:yes gene_type:complete